MKSSFGAIDTLSAVMRAGVALAPLEVHENGTKQLQRLSLVREVQPANDGLDPDAMMADVLAAQQAVRGKQCWSSSIPTST